MPEHAFAIVHDVVILAFHLDKFHRLAQDFEGVEELDALADGHVGIDGAVDEQQRGVDLVGIEQRALGKEVGILPRIAFGGSHGVVAVAPVALAPVAGDVADAGMGDGTGKNVGLRLQILRHETSIRGTEASHMSGIHEGMGGAELLDALDDVVGRPLAPGIHMAGGELLSEADGAAGLDDIDHIAA